MKLLLPISSILIGLLFITETYAQQDPQFTQNSNNRFFANPAVAGSNDATCFNLLLRNQWTGFSGHPQTAALTAHTTVLDIHGGLGVSMMRDALGQEGTWMGKGVYAYRARVGEEMMLSAGFGIGLIRKSLGNNYRTWDGEYGDGTEDPLVNNQPIASSALDLDLGLYLKTNDAYLGISATHINQPTIDLGNETLNFRTTYKLKRHYYVMAGYKKTVYYNVELMPSIFIKSDASSAQFSIDLTGIYREFVWAGLAYRFQDAIAIKSGVYYPMGDGTLKMGYSYDITTSYIAKNSSGSHELLLGYCFKINNYMRWKTVRHL